MMRGWVNENKEYCFECPYCGKVVCSKYLRQASFNIITHMAYCRKRPKTRAELEAIKEGE